MELNSAACATPRFSESLRLVILNSGEAIFKVARDRRRPFIVQTPRHAIADVGTEFDVFATAANTRIAVFKGAVEISPLDTAVRQDAIVFTAGQQIDIPADRPNVRLVKPIDSSDIQRMTAWLTGYIEFGIRPLGQILAEFQRYEHVQFRSRDTEVFDLPFGGTFQTNNLDGFLRALSLQCIHVASHQESGQRIVTLARIPGKRPGTLCR